MTNVTQESGPAEPNGQGGSSQERRGSCRYPVAEVPALLSWWERPEPVEVEVPETLGSGEEGTTAEPTIYSVLMARGPAFRKGSQAFRERTAVTRPESEGAHEEPKLRCCSIRLLDLSQSGMSVSGDTLPALDQRIWVRLEGAHATDWIEVVLRGTSPLGEGSHLIRLAFRDFCPYEFFKAVVYG